MEVQLGWITFPDNPPRIMPLLQFPQRFQKKTLYDQFAKFLNIFKKVHENIHFADALEHMSNYAKFMKEVIATKRKLEYESVKLIEECSIIIKGRYWKS